MGDYGSRAHGYTYVSFPEVINVQAVELYAAATAEMIWSKAPFTNNDKLASTTISPPSGSIYYSVDGLAATNESKIWSSLVEFRALVVGAGVGGQGVGFDVDRNTSVYTVGDGTVDEAEFGYNNVIFPLTYGRVNLLSKTVI